MKYSFNKKENNSKKENPDSLDGEQSREIFPKSTALTQTFNEFNEKSSQKATTGKPQTTNKNIIGNMIFEVAIFSRTL